MNWTLTQLGEDVGQLLGCSCQAVPRENVQSLTCGFSESSACLVCSLRNDTQTRTHQYGCQEAERWGGRYIYYCPRGLIFYAFSSNIDDLFWIVFGPIVMGEKEDLLIDSEGAEFLNGVGQLPSFSPEQMRSIELIVCSAIRGIEAGSEHPVTYNQSQFPKELHATQANFFQDENALFNFSVFKHAGAVYKTMQYLREHWKEKPSLDELAQNVYLSKTYLSVIFKQEVGLSISEYLNKIRIEHSKQQLLEGKKNIANIAVECGFNDQSYFTKVFKKIVGVSPKKFCAIPAVHFSNTRKS